MGDCQKIANSGQNQKAADRPTLPKLAIAHLLIDTAVGKLVKGYCALKHHFGDLLDRESDHWKMAANADRYVYRIGDFKAAQKSVTIVTMTKGDKNWELVGTLPNLVELTLHEPSKEQLEFVSTLWRLKRLRISHARPKSIDFLARLQAIEELVLEYVSGFDDLSPIGRLANLRALHLENLRRVRDFSGLVGANSLKNLYIDGTLDWKQPVESFDFLGELSSLEVFRLGRVKTVTPTPALRSLTRLKHLSRIRIPTNLFPMEEYAFLEMALSTVSGTTFDPCEKFVPYRRMPENDFRFGLSDSDLKADHPDVVVWADGTRQIPDLERSEYWFLGLGARPISCSSARAESRFRENKEKYEEAKRNAAKWLDE